MSDEEELMLKILELFKLKDELKINDFGNVDTETNWQHNSELFKKMEGRGYILSNTSTGVGLIGFSITGVGKTKRQNLQEKKQHEIDERIANERDKELTRQVNKSVLDTNESIIATNDSVQKTNESVQGMNTRTEKIYRFQKRTTRLTIFVAICAVVISLIGLFKKDVSPVDMQSILQETRQMQITIDSLKALKTIPSSVDTHQTKHPK